MLVSDRFFFQFSYPMQFICEFPAIICQKLNLYIVVVLRSDLNLKVKLNVERSNCPSIFLKLKAASNESDSRNDLSVVFTYSCAHLDVLSRFLVRLTQHSSIETFEADQDEDMLSFRVCFQNLSFFCEKGFWLQLDPRMYRKSNISDNFQTIPTNNNY